METWITNNELSLIFQDAQQGGSVAEWLGRRTLNPEVAGSSPALTT